VGASGGAGTIARRLGAVEADVTGAFAPPGSIMLGYVDCASGAPFAAQAGRT